MKNAPTGKTNKSALDGALVSIAIIANSPPTQQAIGLMALMLFALREVML